MTEKPRGLLKAMPVPNYLWQYIGIDFVGPLPESSNQNGSFDMICVIIDALTAMVHLVPTRQTYTATDVAEVVFDTVYKLHGLPERIINNHNSLFTSRLWQKLHALLGVKLRMSSAFHPQTDGTTERANKTMTQMLRQCVSPKQKDWAVKLPAIEFAMNSARSSTTGFTPFYLNYGRNPSPMIWKNEEVYPGVKQFTEDMKNAIMSAHDAIIASRIQHTVQANRKRQITTFKEGDLVYLSTKNINLPKGRARKLAPKFLGPFPISRVVKEGATYQLELSDELIKRGINRTFHASLLRPHVPNDDRRFPGRLPIQIPGFGEKPGEWIVDRIVTHIGKGLESEFQIQWKAGDRTWAMYREVAHLNALGRYCELMGVKNAAQLPANYANPESENESEIIQAKACLVSKGNKRECEEGDVLTNKFPITQTSHLSKTSQSYFAMDGFTTEELQQCSMYELALRARASGVRHAIDTPRPPRYDKYVDSVIRLERNRNHMENGVCHHYDTQPPYYPYRSNYYPEANVPIYHPTTTAPVTVGNVSMPLEALVTIIRAISKPSSTPPRTRVVTHYINRPNYGDYNYGR